MSDKYLDYEHLQYYHEKLKFNLGQCILLSENAIDKIVATEFSEYRNKTYYVSDNNFLRIKLAARYTPSSTWECYPVEWHTSGITISPYCEYAYPNIFSTFTSDALFTVDPYSGETYNIDTREADGIIIELLCTDEDNNLHYFSTIGNNMPNFSESPHSSWGWRQDWNEEEWNAVNFNIPIGESKIYHLNYYSNSYDYEEEAPLNKAEGKFVPSEDFNITIIHNVREYYSMIFS